MPTTSADYVAPDGGEGGLDQTMTPVSSAPSPLGMILRHRGAQTARVLGLYGWLVSGARPDAPSRAVPSPWPGDPSIGQAIMTGRYPFGGTTLTLGDTPWDGAPEQESWSRAAHGFCWLDDLRAAGGDESTVCARRLIAGWLAAQTGLSPAADRLIWSAGVTGQRVRAWLSNWDFIVGDDADGLADGILDSLGRDVRHLGLVAGSEGDGEDRLTAIIGLVQASLQMPGFAHRLPKAIGLLERELSISILPDGCHATRSPNVQLDVMKDLVRLRGLFQEMQSEVPIGLVTAIDRLAPVLRFFRHGDGGLSLFHNGGEATAAEIDAVLGRADARGRPPARCPHGGFERLSAGKLLAIADAGAPPGNPYDSHAHAAPLAVEVSYGPERLIVNCGAARTAEGAWAQAQRSTAAHSTLGIADTNAGEIRPDGRIGHRRASTVVERNEADGAVWVEMSHDGYAKPFGLIHRRRLYMGAEGTDLRGEDSLDGQEGHPFTVRFHLHPKVQVSLLANHSAALLKTPSGSGWRFRAQGGELSLTDSIYLGASPDTKRTQQLILTGVTGPAGATVKWALQRETKR